jgi:hypothetical protein
MTRSSGDVMSGPDITVLSDAQPGVLRVTGMPHGGIVRVNGNELTGIGWADPETMTQYDLQAGDMMVVRELRITDANGVDYLLPNDTSLINHLNGGHYVGFSDFVRQGPIPVNLGIGLIPAATLPPRRSITDVSTDDSIDRSGGPRIMVGVGVGLVPGARSGPGDVFSITGVPSDVVSLIVQENGRVLSGTLASGTWTASSFDVSDAAVISVQPTTAGGVMGEGVRGRALTRTVAIPAAGLSIPYSTLAAPTTQYRRVGEGQTTPPAMTGIVLVGDTNSIGGATFSLDGVAVPYAPGAAQWLPTTPAYTKLFIPAPAGAHVVRLIKGGETRVANATVAAGQVTEIPVTGMQQELVEIQKADDQKGKSDPKPLPETQLVPSPVEPVGPVGPIGPPPVVYPPQARLPQPQPGMSTTSKLIIGGLVAAALGGGYYWYSTRPKANPGKKDCGCGCGGKGGCG